MQSSSVRRGLRVLLLLSLAAAGPLQAGPALLQEGFDGGPEALRARGWALPEGAAVEPSERDGAGDCLRISRPEKRGFAERNVPVERGKVYRASAWVKCRNVTGPKGAVLYLQFSDAERKHVNGGAFPIGLIGTHDWREVVVHHTIPIPEGVAFVRVTVGVDGTGEAWFDDTRLWDEWTGPLPQEPRDGAMVATAIPELRWESWAKLFERMSDGAHSQDVELSRDATFADGPTIRVSAAASENRVRLTRALSSGRWYWRIRVRRGDAVFPPGQTASFEVAEDAAVWPPEAFPDWRWSDAPRPELAVAVTPPEATIAKVEAWVNGRPAEITSRRPGRIAFRPAADLPIGIHEVKVTLHGRTPATDPAQVTVSGIFCNKQPATRVTFRPDGLMLVDGKPTFPIGAYRDPSDREDVFDGLVEAGFDVTHSYRMDNEGIRKPAERRAYLEGAHARGIGVFLGMPRDMVRKRQTAELARYVAETMDTPGLLAWYQFDEPEIQDCSPEDLMATYRAIRAVDPFHPKITLVCSIKSPVTDRFRAYAAGCDLFWEDPYPVPTRPLLMVEEKIRACIEAGGPGKPVWCVIQGFSWEAWRAYKSLKLGGKRTPETVAAMRASGTVPVTRPSAAETRCMAHLAIAAGARGLIWYWSPNAAVHVREDSPEVWAGVRATVKELRSLMPWLLAETTPEDAIAVPAPLRCWSRKALGERVFVLINPEEREVRVPAADLPEVIRRALPAGATEKAFAPHEVVVLRR